RGAARRPRALRKPIDLPLQGGNPLFESVETADPLLQLVDAFRQSAGGIEEPLSRGHVRKLPHDVLAAVGELAQEVLFALRHPFRLSSLSDTTTRCRRAASSLILVTEYS